MQAFHSFVLIHTTLPHPQNMRMSTCYSVLYALFYLCSTKVLVVAAFYPLPNGDGSYGPPRKGLGGVVDDYLAGGVRQGKVLIKYGNITGWDMRQVTNMAWVFYSTSYNGDISSWDTSAVTNMNGSKYYSKH